MAENTVTSVKADGSELGKSQATRRQDSNLVDPQVAAAVSENAVFMQPSELGALMDTINNATEPQKPKTADDFKSTVVDVDQLIGDDATAAGLGLAGNNAEEGHTFIQLDRIVELVNPAAYEFPINPTGVPPQINGDAAPVVDTIATAVNTTPDEPPIDPPPEEEEKGRWQIDETKAAGDEYSTFTIDEGESDEFNVSLGGAGNAKLEQGDSETIKLAVVGGVATFGTDFTLSVDGGTNVFAEIIESGSDYIIVKMTALNEVNLTGLGFKVTVSTLNDVAVENLEHVKFEIQDPSYGDIRLDKDDIGYDIIDTTEPPPPPPPPPPPEDDGQNWFISQQGNNNFDQAIALHEGDIETFNVQFQDRSGIHLGRLEEGETVNLKISVSGSNLSMLDVLEVDPANGLDASWTLENGLLDIYLTATKDTNLQGNPVDVTFKVLNDNKVGTNESLSFDILSSSIGDAWESNDQANYTIADIIVKGGSHNQP